MNQSSQFPLRAPSLDLSVRDMEIYRLFHVEKRPIESISAKLGLGRSTVYRILRTFEASNPEKALEMRKEGKDVTTDSYEQLQAENARLQAELKREKLRADFYEEMVAFGKEVYGIDLKKAGTK